MISGAETGWHGVGATDQTLVRVTARVANADVVSLLTREDEEGALHHLL